MSAGSSGGLPDSSLRQLPEIKACSASRAEARRELIFCRNLVPARLEELDCPPRARESLSSWLEDLERDLPDPAALAASMADATLHPEEFNARWAEVERIRRDAAKMPATAVDFLHAVAGHAAAGKLGLLYWACLHYPLLDRYADLSKAVGKLFECEWMNRSRQAQRIRQNAKAARDAVCIYSYDSFDFYGSCFGWNLRIYRVDGGVVAEIHQWTEDEDAADPRIEDVHSGLDLADWIRGGEIDGIWELDRQEWLGAVERVFEFDRALGVDFLDAVVHEYEIDPGKIERPGLRAAWQRHLAELNEADAGKGLDKETGALSAAAARAAAPEVPEAADSAPAYGETCRRFEDPIAATLARMKIEPVEIDPRNLTSITGPWRRQIEAKRRAERDEAARGYLIHFAQQNLELPRGRHTVRRDGGAGIGFWVDFQ